MLLKRDNLLIKIVRQKKVKYFVKQILNKDKRSFNS